MLGLSLSWGLWSAKTKSNNILGLVFSLNLGYQSLVIASSISRNLGINLSQFGYQFLAIDPTTLIINKIKNKISIKRINRQAFACDDDIEIIFIFFLFSEVIERPVSDF